MRKNVGILIPLASLPGNHGIGDFGDFSFEFINWLSKNHYRYWQILPLNPLGKGTSPYSSNCSYAIDFRYISLDKLQKEGYLDEVPTYRKESPFINYKKVSIFKEKYLRIAYAKFIKTKVDALKKFKTRHPWVMKYATYEVFKKKNNDLPWNEWKSGDVDYFEKHNNPPKSYLKEINFYIFEQFIAYNQLHRLLSYAREKDIKVIADMPFYVGFDSVECWTNKNYFAFDKSNKQTLVGGVPPDYFSEDGQLWGSPIYLFDKMKKDNYKLLVDRIGYLTSTFDYLRIDHFRAFDTYYVIPSDEQTARNGEWKEGPGEEFFKCLYKKYPSSKLIAEDLGDLFPSVIELRKKLKLPGMYVTEFMIFDDIDTKDLIVYSGTHDNETLYGWIKEADDELSSKLCKKFKCRKRDLYRKIINFILNKESKITILPIQDILMLDNKARLNIPGVVNETNFTWRLKSFEILNKKKVKIR